MRSAVLGKKQEKSFPHLNVYQSVKNFSRWSGTQAKYSQVFKKKKKLLNFVQSYTKIPSTIPPLKDFLHGWLPTVPPCFWERLGRMCPSYRVSAWLNAGTL